MESKVKHIVLVALFIGIVVAQNRSSSIPFTFQPNTPAKASEVNSNFQFLQGKLNQNSTDVSELEEAVSSLEGELGNGHPWKLNLTYTYANSNVGDTVTYTHSSGSYQHKIVEVPCRGLVDGTRYTVKMPVFLAGSSGSSQLSTKLKSSFALSNVSLGGYDAYVSAYPDRRYSYSDAGAGATQLLITSFVYIYVDKTVLNFHPEFPSDLLEPSGYDFKGDVESYMDWLIDHIEVTGGSSP